jgi:hypothetical protein
MDFSHISFEELWKDEATTQRRSQFAKWYAGLFAWFGLNLIISIVLTMKTGPGHIPDYKEWDMSTASES